MKVKSINIKKLLFTVAILTVGTNANAHDIHGGFAINDDTSIYPGRKHFKYKKYVGEIVQQLENGIKEGVYDQSYIINILDYIKSGSWDSTDLQVTYTINDALDGDVITTSGELVLPILPGREIDKLHAATHGLHPIERHAIPPYYDIPKMDKVDDFVVEEDEMVIINPAPGEYVRIVEGKRHGYKHTTVGISRTLPGGGAPYHTHESEESHVLLKGKMRYQLGEDVFEVEAPYVINIPPMVPHAFMSLNKQPIELVVFFPVNKWEFDFVEHANADTFFQLPQNLKYDQGY